jgi:hypothetical protein
MAASLYKQYTKLTLEERQYLGTHPHHAMTIEQSTKDAYQETQRRFGRNGRNDKSDAFRHCFWSAILARELGVDNALRFTSAHEAHADNDPAEKEMDLHNNKVGIGFGKNAGTNQELSFRCMFALNGGQLKILVK